MPIARCRKSFNSNDYSLSLDTTTLASPPTSTVTATIIGLQHTWQSSMYVCWETEQSTTSSICSPQYGQSTTFSCNSFATARLDRMDFGHHTATPFQSESESTRSQDKRLERLSGRASRRLRRS
jgi:hypothetical protein